NVHEYNQNRKESPSNVYGMPVFHDGRLFVASGGDLWWGKREARIQCIDVSAEPDAKKDITRAGLIWARDLERHVMSTPAIHDGIVYIADARRMIYALDERSGEVIWTHEAKGEFWASPYVADGKVHIGSRRGDFYILRAGRTKEVLTEIDFGVPISSTAVAANGTLYIATMSHLYAIAPAGS